MGMGRSWVVEHDSLMSDELDPAEEVAARKLYEKLGFEERAYFLAKRL